MFGDEKEKYNLKFLDNTIHRISLIYYDNLIDENIKFKQTTEINGANFIESMQAHNNKLYVATNNGFYI